MISEKYKQQLLQECRQLDSVTNSSKDLEKIGLEITQNNNDRSSLELLNKLGNLSKRYSISKIDKKNEQISELLFKYLGALKIDLEIEKLKNESNSSLSELMSLLNELVGLDSVKQQVNNLIEFNQVQQLREKSGLQKSSKTMHMAFLGNPGTAKTTVARIVGRMYKAIGILSKGQLIEASRTDLIAEYQGQTASKVKHLVNQARGGVLFIDEAYSLTENDHSDSYGRESLTELTKALEDYRDDLVVIVAGYTDLMKMFFESNPGLKSRFNTFIIFEDYSIDELVGIFEYLCKTNDYLPKSEAMLKVRKYLELQIENKNDYFSNGRAVRNLFDDTIMNQAVRLSSIKTVLSKEILMSITQEDVPIYVQGSFL